VYLEELRRAVMESSGATDRALRAAAASGGDLPADLAPVIAKIRANAYKVTDEDIAALKKGGRSEDEIFELTIAAALGVSIHRASRALAACGLSETDGEKK
jgi:hypothetical protein